MAKNSAMLKENYKILIADPDRRTTDMLTDLFTKEGYTVIEALNGKDLVEKASRYHPHFIILEVLLPDVDGIEVCYELRSNPSTRETLVAFYTSRSEDYSQVAAFKAGADDYILKPARGNVLLMRTKALLRRQKHVNDRMQEQDHLRLRIDRERYIVTVDGTEMTLPRKEFQLLELLFSSPRKVFTRKEIARLIWGYEIEPHNRTIDVHVRKLREKLGNDHIKTVKGIGYSLEF